jgi:hypothetical protein
MLTFVGQNVEAVAGNQAVFSALNQYMPRQVLDDYVYPLVGTVQGAVWSLFLI